MSRAFCIPSAIILFCALVLSFLASISLPYLPGLDIARTQAVGATVQDSQSLTEIRFGIWAPCYYNSKNDRTCLPASHAYNVTVTGTGGNVVAFVDSSWTRGLVVQPVATIATFFAFFFSLFSTDNAFMKLLTFFVAFLAAMLTLIAFAIDIALFALVKHEMNKLGADITTITGPGFWLTFVSLILLLVGGCTVCFGRNRDRRLSGARDTNINTTPKRKFFGRNKA